MTYYLPPPAPPIALLCAVNPVARTLTIDTRAPIYFYSRYRPDGSREHTFRGLKIDLELLHMEDVRANWRVSAIYPELPLSDNLKYTYSWHYGHEIQELRPEYRPKDEKKAA